MSKTVAISEDMHIKITKMQTFLYEEYGMSIRIADLVDRSIKLGLDNVVQSFVPNNIKIIDKEDVRT